MQEHVTIVSEPNSEYIGHISPANGTSKSIKEPMVKFFEINKLSTDELLAIRCDGTNVNTGNSNGIIFVLWRSILREQSSG